MKKVVRYVFLLVVMCALGYSVGYFYISDTSAVAVSNDNIDLLENTIAVSDNMAILNLFNGNLYENVYIEDTMSYKINRKEVVSRTVNDEVYMKEDVYQLALEVVQPKYDLVVVRETEGYIRYEEYQGNYPTGAYASFVFDDDGAVLQARFREGVIYDVVDSKMISHDKAFELAINSIREKYGEDVIIEGKSTEHEYKVCYNPNSQNLCYMINDVKGYLDCDKKDDNEQVEFFITVDIKGEFVEVGSTLGY